jgi:bifunctional non-homologous end joining protein LigD
MARRVLRTERVMAKRKAPKRVPGKVASLAAYRRKRDFTTTREPRGGTPGRGRLYVIQKHAASRLHYDFRLELDGTLKSWAIPKGPSVDPKAKRLAVHVEDHPVEYGSFEGVIPKGEYGGGTVMLWDQGSWEPLGDPRKDYRDGRLKFRLHGRRLQGVWALVRMGGAAGENGKNWLLVKDRDSASGGREPVAVPASSVASGRSMEDIRKDGDRVWGRDGEEPTGAAKLNAAGLADAPRGKPRPDFTPMLATLAAEVPQGDGWIHEIKLDGYRTLAVVQKGRVALKSRNGLDWTARFPEIAAAIRALPMTNGVVDGEVVALASNGKSDFQLLQNHLKSKTKNGVVYFAFDLPFFDGRDLRKLPLTARKRVLGSLLSRASGSRVRFGEHFDGSGERVFEQACKLGLEGIVSKRADSPYESRRAKSWLKIKCSGRQEFVIAGWTDPQGGRTGFGSLVLAHHDDNGGLVYAGKVGTGFDQKLLSDLSWRFSKLARKERTLRDAPASETRGVHWVKPELVAEVSFTEWTRDGRLRHPSFLGLREDKRPAEVVGERVRAAAPLTHPDRVLWPEGKITKADLAAHYESVAALMLPQVAGRPLAIVRCPEGRTGPCFFQKHAAKKSSEHLSIDDLDGLIGLVQMGALEIHPWGAKSQDIERPDRLVFDLDPGPGVTWSRVVDGAFTVRDRLAEFSLASFVRTTGGKGLHVVVPLTGRVSWDDLKAFARGIADGLVQREPERYIATAAKSRRSGRIFIDWLRNAQGATAIASYSTRKLPGAPIATPLSWDELRRVKSGDAFKLRGFEKRLAKAGDPWKGLAEARQAIPASVVRLLLRGTSAGRRR